MFGCFSKHVLTLNLCLAAAGAVVLVASGLVLQAADKQTAASESSPATSGERASQADVETKPAATWQDAVKMFAAAAAISLTAFATAMTQCRIGSAGIGALAENPKLFGNILVFLVVPETMVILGFVVAALMLF
jgi:V/A-type H+-transporting ATPase subunit K